MATVLKFPDRPIPRAAEAGHVPPRPASIVILPCIRRERIAPVEAPSAQRQA